MIKLIYKEDLIFKIYIYISCFECKEKMYHRVSQVGRHFSKSLIQPPAQNRVDTEFRSGVSRLYPLVSLKPLITDIAHVLREHIAPRQPAPMLD